MSKRRTKKDKIIAQLRRNLSTQKKGSFNSKKQDKFDKGSFKKSLKNKSRRSKLTTLLTYDSLLIKKDLIRTAALSSVIFAIEILIYFYLK